MIALIAFLHLSKDGCFFASSGNMQIFSKQELPYPVFITLSTKKPQPQHLQGLRSSGIIRLKPMSPRCQKNNPPLFCLQRRAEFAAISLSTSCINLLPASRTTAVTVPLPLSSWARPGQHSPTRHLMPLVQSAHTALALSAFSAWIRALTLHQHFAVFRRRIA